MRSSFIHVHGARFRHEVVVHPGAVVLVPLPDVAVEGHLSVDLELVHVHVFPEDLHDGIDHAGMARQPREGLAVHVRGEIGAHHVAGLLAHVLGPALRVQARHLVGEELDFLRREERGKEKVTVAIELLELLRGELHAGLRADPLIVPRFRALRAGPAPSRT
jgi:hypothetical protein